MQVRFANVDEIHVTSNSSSIQELKRNVINSRDIRGWIMGEAIIVDRSRRLFERFEFHLTLSDRIHAEGTGALIKASEQFADSSAFRERANIPRLHPSTIT
jgi:hypothetical protein